MQQAKLPLAALMLTMSVLSSGCGDAKPAPVNVQELTPAAIAEQEAVLNEAAAAEAAERKKNKH